MSVPDRVSRQRSGRVQIRASSHGKSWTKTRRTLFLDHLAATCNVTRSAAAAGMHVNAVRSLRRADSGFAALWDAALADGYERIEAELMAQALGTSGGDAGDDDLNAIEPDGDRAENVPAFDPDLALRVLARRDAAMRPGARRPRLHYNYVSIEDVEKALLRQLAAIEKRLKAK